MIKITGVKIVDFGRHKLVEETVDGYIVGLCGPNGKGKSTVLQAIQYALTGLIDHPDPLRAFIRRSGGEKPPKAASVVVNFEADGRPGTITRRITKSSSTRKLEWDDGAKPLTSDKAVTEAMFDILGVDKKAINSTVFIRQGEMASMFGKDVERRDFYTRLLMLGHLEKIADIIETHCKHQADSVQDLTGVRHAAEETYSQASAYFTECDEALRAMVKPTEKLAATRGLLGMFTNLANAEDEAVNAEKAMGSLLSSATFEADKTAEIKSDQAQLTKLSERKAQYLQASTTLRITKEELDKGRQNKELFNELRDAQVVISKLECLSSSPAPRVESLKARIADAAELEALQQSLPGVLATRDEYKLKLVAATAAEQSASTSYQALRDEFTKVRGDKEMRENIQKELAGASSDCGCPVCGGAPNSVYLESSIAELTTQLDTLKNKGGKLRDEFDAATAELRQITADYAKYSDLADNQMQRKKVLTALLLVVNINNLPHELEQAEAEFAAWSAKAFENKRCMDVLAQCERKTVGVVEPSDKQLAEWQRVCDEAEAVIAECNWSAEDSEVESNLNENIKVAHAELNSYARLSAAVKAAEELVSKRQQALADTLEALSDDLRVEFAAAGDTVITPAVVDAKIQELQDLQSAYDVEAGKRESANKALRSASDSIAELDLRIAEQKHRLILVDDLKRLRDTFKPQGVSLEYLDYKFGQIAELASDYLAESQADFMVAASVDQPLAFEFLRTDGIDEVWMPQNRMSGGQKVRLAVATLRAIHALIMPNVGLMALDEPTTHLDDEAKRSMADMLRRIGDEGTLQMLVCDHSPILIDAFSDTIEIKS